MAMAGVTLTKTLRDEKLDGLPHEFASGISEQFFRLGIDQRNLPVSVDDHHRIRRGFQQSAKLLFRSPALGDVEVGGEALQRLAIRIEFDEPLALDVALDPIVAENPVFDLADALAGGEIPERGLDTRAVVRHDVFEQEPRTHRNVGFLLGR